MVGLVRVGAVALMATVAECGLFSYYRDDAKTWTPVKTAEVLLSDSHVGPDAPAPTVPPTAATHELRKRAADTCGYVSGISSRAVTCVADGSECRYNSDASAIGCCATSACTVWTTCLPYLSSSIYSASDFESKRTRYCSKSESPYCGVYLYQDARWSGYTMNICAPSPTTIMFYQTPLGVPDDTTTTSRTSYSTKSPDTTSSDLVGVGGTTSSPAPGPTTTIAQPSGSSSNTGAIVGGVVGGVGGIALIGLGVFFLFFRKKDKQTPPPGPQQPQAGPGPMQYYNAGPGPNMGGYPQQMQQQPNPAMGYFPPPGQQDPRLSMMKPGMSPSTMSYDPRASMMGSPPPTYPPGPNSVAAVGVAPAWQPGQNGQQAYSPPQQQLTPEPTGPSQGWQQPGSVSPSQHTTSPVQPQFTGGQQSTYSHPSPVNQTFQQGYQPQQGAVEMPTTRGHGEVRELGA